MQKAVYIYIYQRVYGYVTATYNIINYISYATYAKLAWIYMSQGTAYVLKVSA